MALLVVDGKNGACLEAADLCHRAFVSDGITPIQITVGSEGPGYLAADNETALNVLLLLVKLAGGGGIISVDADDVRLVLSGQERWHCGIAEGDADSVEAKIAAAVAGSSARHMLAWCELPDPGDSLAVVNEIVGAATESAHDDASIVFGYDEVDRSNVRAAVIWAE